MPDHTALNNDIIIRGIQVSKARTRTIERTKRSETQSAANEPKKPRVDPFSHPDPDLVVVAGLHGSHNIILNKFPVVDRHALLCTVDFIPQNEHLNVVDFTAITEVFNYGLDDFLMFYNCGYNSGASQGHKHVQFIPLRCSVGGSEEVCYPIESWVRAAVAWKAVEMHCAPGECIPCDKFIPIVMPTLTFRHCMCLLPENCTPHQMKERVEMLLQKVGIKPATDTAEQTVAQTTEQEQHSQEEAIPYSVSPPLHLTNMTDIIPDEANEDVSYNLLMTKRWAAVFPRKQEKSGSISINSMAFAGSMFVRSEAELKELKERGPMKILEEVSVPW